MPKKSGSTAGRNVHIADRIQRDLAELIQHEVKNPAMGLVMLRSVTLTPDYAYARTYSTVSSAEPEVAGAIPNEKTGYPHSLLFKRLHVHTVPTLRFHFDGPVGCDIETPHLIDEANATYAKDNWGG